MRLDYPIKRPAQQTQGFAQNANELYKSQGLIGHSGQDYGGQYGDTIYVPVDSYYYSFLNRDQSPDKYRACYLIVDEEDFSYEVSLGHVIDDLLEEKQFVKKGTPIARMGNFGDVFSGGRKITVEERLNGSHAGVHLHWQIRLCKRVKKRDNKKHYLLDSKGHIKLNGVFYEVVDYDNGTNGCIDIAPFLTGKYANEKEDIFPFSKDLSYGMTDPEVKELQKWLNNNGFPVATSGAGSKGNETDYFGSLTRASVIRYQLAKGIKPAVGYFGPLTRKSLT